MSSDSHEPDVIAYRETSPNYHHFSDLTWFPVNHNQVRDLLGRLLTQLDAMGLPDRAHKAARTLITADVWRWFDAACYNATTSADGCLAPIVMTRTSWPVGEPPPAEPASNRWGWSSERAWFDSRSASSQRPPAEPGPQPAVSGRAA